MSGENLSAEEDVEVEEAYQEIMEGNTKKFTNIDELLGELHSWKGG
jgi:hypothetical protein